MENELEETKKVIGIRKSKKDRQHNGKKNKDLRSIKHYIKTQHRATRAYWW